MVGEWHDLHWGDLATLEYGKSLRGYQDAGGAFRVYGTNGPIGWNDEALCNHPGVIVGRKGAYRGVHYSPEPFFVIDTAFYLEPKADMDLRWAYYELLAHDINGLDSGSAIPSTSREAFYGIPVKFPPLPEQRAIAHILGALDDKIELNRRMNATLEEMARALFKSWFVDFDPVRAKAEGRDAGLPPALASLFPDGFDETLVGEVPRGWRVGTIRDCCTRIENGGTPQRSEPTYWQPAVVPWLTSGEVRQSIVTDTENMVSEEGLAHSSAKMWPSGTTVVALYGATAGQVCLLAKEMCANQACCGLVPAEKMRSYLYLGVSSSVASLERQARGSAQQNLSQQIVADFRVLIASGSVIEVFEESLSPIFEHWILNLRESRTLAALRTALLPELLAGKVRVAPIEGY